VAKANETIVVRKRGGGFFWGFLCGILTGVALALLFAPEQSETMREQTAEIRQRGQAGYAMVRDQLRERASEAMVQGRVAYQRAKDQLLAQYAQNRNGRS
jgi:gas vesicle protein